MMAIFAVKATLLAKEKSKEQAFLDLISGSSVVVVMITPSFQRLVGFEQTPSAYNYWLGVVFTTTNEPTTSLLELALHMQAIRVK